MTGDGSHGCPIACFFKLILELRLDLHKLELPRKFVRTHGNNLSNVIYLNIPSGKVWEFNLVRENGKAFLQKGWTEFVQFYSLNDRHCLLFKYEGDACFDVIIFDTSTSEIEYPFDPKACRESHPLQKRKTIDFTKPSSSKKVISRPSKRMQSVTFSKLIIAYNKRYGGLTPEESKRVCAYYANHCKHPSFATKMYPSFVDQSLKSKNFCMGIPREFAKKFLYNEPCPCTVNLQTDTRKIWPVKSYPTCATNMKLQGEAWKYFVSGNKLKEGDICIFELLNKQEFKVHMLRVANTKENSKSLLAIKVEAD